MCAVVVGRSVGGPVGVVEARGRRDTKFPISLCPVGLHARAARLPTMRIGQLSRSFSRSAFQATAQARLPCTRGLISPLPSQGLLRSVSTKATESGNGGSIAAQRLRSPVTWLSASATLAALYGLYEFQKTRQATAQRAAGKPDLGGEFSLVDADGKRYHSDDFKGKWALLYFGFTKCPDICPEELHKVTGVLKRLEEERGQPIQPVFITIDPSRDTRDRLKSYFATAGFHEKFIALTGTHDEVRKACRAFRVYFTKPLEEEVKRGDYLLDHSIISYLIDPDGEFADYYGKSLSADEMLTRVSKLISDWERQRWWDSVLPASMSSQQTDGVKRAKEAARGANL
jgi:protein SCO1/2